MAPLPARARRNPPRRLAPASVASVARAPASVASVARALAAGALALELVLRAPLPRLGGSPLAPALDVRLENRGPASLPFATAGAAALTFEAEVERASDGVTTLTIYLNTEGNALAPARDAIAPGQRRSVLLPTTKTDAHSGFGLVPPGERVARVRARYEVGFDDAGGFNQRSLWSPWVPVPPAPRPVAASL